MSAWLVLWVKSWLIASFGIIRTLRARSGVVDLFKTTVSRKGLIRCLLGKHSTST